jgi:hypothetical protein
MDNPSTPIAGNLTPAQIDDANDAWAAFEDAQKAVTAGQGRVNVDPSPANKAALAEAKATAGRFLDRWYSLTGFPPPPCGNSACDPGP